MVSWEMDLTLEISFVLEAVKRALTRSRPEIMNSDQGSQFTSPCVAMGISGLSHSTRAMRCSRVMLKNWKKEALESLPQLFDKRNIEAWHLKRRWGKRGPEALNAIPG